MRLQSTSSLGPTLSGSQTHQSGKHLLWQPTLYKMPTLKQSYQQWLFFIKISKKQQQAVVKELASKMAQWVTGTC